MEITVKMTPEEYDLFRVYQNEKEFFERRLREETKKFQKEHEELCSLIVNALDTKSQRGKPTQYLKIMPPPLKPAELPGNGMCEEERKCLNMQKTPPFPPPAPGTRSSGLSPGTGRPNSPTPGRRAGE